MKITLNESRPDRTLVALIERETGSIYFYAGAKSKLLYGSAACIQAGDYPRLEVLKENDPKLIPVYEGDSVTLQF